MKYLTIICSQFLSCLGQLRLALLIAIFFLAQPSFAYQINCASGLQQVSFSGLSQFASDWPFQYLAQCQSDEKVHYYGQGWLPQLPLLNIKQSRSRQTVASQQHEAQQSLLLFDIQQAIYKFPHAHLQLDYHYSFDKAFIDNTKDIDFIAASGQKSIISQGQIINYEHKQQALGISFRLRSIEQNPVDIIALQRISIDQPMQVKIAKTSSLNASKTLLLATRSRLYQLALEHKRHPRGWHQNWRLAMLYGKVRVLSGAAANNYDGAGHNQALAGGQMYYQLAYRQRINMRWHWAWRNQLEALFLTTTTANKDEAEYASFTRVSWASTLSLEVTF